MAEDNEFHLNEVIFEEKSSSEENFVDYENSTDKTLLSANGYIASAVVLFFIGVIGFSLNFIVIFVTIKEKSLRTPFNLILVNLSFADLFISILGNPITFTAAVHRKWIFGRTICVFYGLSMAVTGIASITTITVLSYERYLIIAKSFHSRRLTMARSKLVICGIWIYSLMLTSPPLIGWGDYVNESANISCSVNWEHQNFATTMYIIYLFVMGLVLPFCIICFSYVKIILILMQKKVPRGQVSKVELRIALMIAVMVAVFLLSWVPYGVVSLMVAFGYGRLVTPAVSVIPALLAKSSICYNPIIYAGLNSQIRAAAFKMFGFQKFSGRPADDAESRMEADMSNTRVHFMESVFVRKSMEVISEEDPERNRGKEFESAD